VHVFWITRAKDLVRRAAARLQALEN